MKASRELVSPRTFAERLKLEQRRWADAMGFEDAWFDPKHGAKSHVLKPEHRFKNLYDPSWWRHIEGKNAV